MPWYVIVLIISSVLSTLVFGGAVLHLRRENKRLRIDGYSYKEHRFTSRNPTHTYEVKGHKTSYYLGEDLMRAKIIRRDKLAQGKQAVLVVDGKWRG